MTEKREDPPEVAPQSNASNGQANHNNNPRSVISATTCTHGNTYSHTFARFPSDINAAAIKATDFQNHQRILVACNCTLV